MTVLRTQLSGIARRPARLLLTGLAVLVASFVVYATVLAQQITERSVLSDLSGTPAAVDLVVKGSNLSTTQLARAAAVPGVAETVGRTAVGAQTGGEYLYITADPGTGPLAVAHVVRGAYPSGPRQIAVTPRTADRMALSIGAVVPMVTSWSDDGKPGKPVRVTVTGIVDSPKDYGADAYAPEATVVALAGSKKLDQIDIRLATGADATAVRAALDGIAAALPAPADGAEATTVQTGAEVRTEEAESAAAGVRQLFLVVGLFVAIAVVAAGLVAASTFRIVFAQRMRQLALLRAIGAGRGTLVRALAAEGALTGLCTGITGVLAALAVGHLLPRVLKAFGVVVAGPGFPLAQGVGVVLLAVLITVLVVLAPAVSAARVSPLEALRASGTTAGKIGIGVPRWVTGLLLTAGAVASAAWVAANLPGRDPKNYDANPMLLAVIASGALTFLALITLGPALIRPVLAVLGWPVRRFGPVGKLAVGGIGGAPRRAAAVSVVVALGVTLIAGTLVGGASMRTLADRETAASAPADYELQARPDSGGVTPKMLAEARAQAGLTHVTPYRRLTEVRIGAAKANLEAVDLDAAALPALGKADVTAGTMTGVRPGQVVISGFTADVSGLGLGDATTVTVAGRRVAVTVSGVLPDSAPLGAALLLNPADLTRLGAGSSYAGLLADASAGGETGRTAGQQALRAVTGGADGFGVAVLADQRDEINRTITTLLAVAVGLIGLTVLIAVVGVGTTTALSVVERIRESGLLRAVGLSRPALRTMLTTESSLYGVIGAAIGLVLGVPYAWLAISALGVNAPLALPGWQLAAVFLVLVVVTALAGVLPARRAARVSPVTALGTE